MQRIFGAPCLVMAVVEVHSSGEGQAIEKCVARNDFHTGVHHIAHIGMTVIHGVHIGV